MPKESDLSSSKRASSQARVKRVARKAPTPLKQQMSSQKQFQKQTLVSVALFLLILFGSVGIGIADEGQINVAEVIQERNVRVASGEEEAGSGGQVVQVPKANTSPDLPDGGLKGLGKSTPPPAAPPEVVASSTASSTVDGTASTTLPVATTTTDVESVESENSTESAE